MTSGAKRTLNIVIGIGLAVVLLWLTFRSSDWSAVGSAIAHIDVPLLIFAYLFQLMGIIIKSWRWRLLLTPLKKDVPLHSCWKYFNIAFATTSLLPGRIGELLRPYLLAREQEMSFPATFATIFTERVIDLVVILGFFSTIFIFPSVLGPDPADPRVGLLKTAGFVTLGVALVTIAFLVLVKLRTDWAVAIVRFFAKPLPKKFGDAVVHLVENFAEGIGGLRGASMITALVVSSILGWCGGVVFFWLAFKAFGLTAPFYAFFFLQAVTALGVTIPTPAGSGGFHYAVLIVAHHLWGHPEATVQAFALITHLVTFGSMTIIGSWYLLTGGINIFKTVKRVEQRTTDMSEENQAQTGQSTTA